MRVPAPGGVPVVKAAAPWAVEYDDHTAAYLSGRPHTAGDLPVDPEGMKQGGGIHQGAKIVKEGLVHAESPLKK